MLDARLRVSFAVDVHAVAVIVAVVAANANTKESAVLFGRDLCYCDAPFFVFHVLAASYQRGYLSACERQG